MTLHVHFVHNHEISVPPSHSVAKHGLATSFPNKKNTVHFKHGGFHGGETWKPLVEIVE